MKEMGDPAETKQTVGPATPGNDLLSLPLTGDIERLVRARGAMFLVTTRQGDVTPAGARELGLFYQDTRFLSHYELEVSNCRAARLSAETSHPAYNQVDLMLSDPEHEELLEDPSNFLHIRRRRILDGGLLEEIVFTNFLMRACDIEVVVRFGADFADVFEVRGAKRAKRGSQHRARVEGASVVLGYTGLCGRTYETVVSFGVAPTELAADHAVFELNLSPDRSTTIEVRVAPVIDGVTPSRPGLPFARSAEMRASDAQAFRAGSTTYVCDNGMLQDVLEQSAADLHALRVEFDRHTIVGAGIPWFCAPFGRDALITAYEALTLNPDFATEALRTLAAFQGQTFDPRTEEEPGKIFHELRFGEMARTGEIPHSPYYGSIDATPLFVIVAEALHRFAGDAAFLRELRPSIEAALGWIDARSGKGTELVRYEKQSPQGLLNQGWKDSRAGVSFPDGRAARAAHRARRGAGLLRRRVRRAARDLPLPRRRRARARLRRARREHARPGQPRVLDARGQPVRVRDRRAGPRAAHGGIEHRSPALVARRAAGPGDGHGAHAPGLVELQRVRHSHAGERPARLQPAQLPQRHGVAARQRAHRRAGS